MDYELPEELRMLKETLRRFVDREIIPIERDAYEGHQLKPEVRVSLEEKAKEIAKYLKSIKAAQG